MKLDTQKIFMANQRDKDKRLIGAFVPSKLKRQIAAIARRDGIAASDLVKRLLVEYVNDPANSVPDSEVGDTIEEIAQGHIASKPARGRKSRT